MATTLADAPVLHTFCSANSINASVAAYLLKGVAQLENEIVGCLALGLVQHIVQQRLSHSQPKLTPIVSCLSLSYARTVCQGLAHPLHAPCPRCADQMPR